MKKIKLLLGLTILPLIGVSQSTTPTNLQNFPQTRYLGFSNNFPLYTRTSNVLRTKLNENVNYAVNGFIAPRNGYFLIGQNATLSSDGQLIYNARGAFSQLHLHGTGVVQEFGYRPWMKTGITLTDNSDLSYIGLRQLGAGIDVTEMVINWTDNNANPPFGPDDMVFRFTSAGTGNPGINTNRIVSTDLDGLHVARYSPDGRYALGNTFGINVGTTQYVRPQSLFHMSYDWRNGVANDPYGFMQVTYRHPTNISGSGESVNDGLRFGIDNTVVNNSLNAYLRWQENTPFIVQTDWNTTAGGTQQGERMRISSINAPGVPLPSGSASGDNITRVAISHQGDQPITAPRSLLHLGYNTGTPLLPGLITDGWRNWMDVGTFTNVGSDNMYVGMKNEGTDKYDAVINWGDNQVAGTNQNGPDHLRFIFTSSTSTPPPGQGDPFSQSNNGLEIARMDPGVASTMGTNYGMLGVGNFTDPGPNALNPVDAKLDIDGDLRIRTVTQDTTLDRILVIDTTDLNRVHWRSINDFGTDNQNLTSAVLNGTDLTISIEDGSSVTVNLANLQDGIGTDDQNLTGAVLNGNILTISIENGAPVSVNLSALQSIDTDNQLLYQPTIDCNTGILTLGIEDGNTVQVNLSCLMGGGSSLGNNCGLSNPNLLTSSWEIPLNNNNFIFSNNNSIGNVGIGGYNCTPQDKLTISGNSLENSTGISVTNITDSPISKAYLSFTNNLPGNNATFNFHSSNYLKPNLFELTTPSDIDISPAFNNNINLKPAGGSGLVNINNVNPNNITSTATLAVHEGIAIENTTGFGAHLQLNSGTSTTAILSGDGNGGRFMLYQYGTSSPAIEMNALSPQLNIGLGVTQSGMVNVGGSVYANGSQLVSDSLLKQNITSLSEDWAVEKIASLNPISYEWISKNDTIMYGTKYGFTAQQVESIMPDLVFTDSLGKKSLDYVGIIPVLVKSNQFHAKQIDTLTQQNDSLKFLVNDLNERLANLENCLSGILPYLCQLSNSSIEQNDYQLQQSLIETINIELRNNETIVLDQNVPNPFAESTVINYTVPASVLKAEIMFYNGNGLLLKTILLTERGAGAIRVYGSDLSSGVYTYSLIADGQIVSTKKMVKQ